MARDRVISHSNPEMRHGRKSAPRRFDGHELDVITDEDTELVLGVEVRAANAADGEGTVPLLSRVMALPGIVIGPFSGTWLTPTATCAERWKKRARSWWPRCRR